MSVAAYDVLQGVSFSLVEPFVSFTTGVISAGVHTITPPSMTGIYVGAQLVVGNQAPGSSNQEVITVTAITATTFTATFVFNHISDAFFFGATFPSGQPDHPLFTQAEMLQYLVDAQKDFLLRTGCVVSVSPTSGPGTISTAPGVRYYTQPSQAIRVERISISGKELRDTSQRSLDLFDPNWAADVQQGNTLSKWFQDESNTAMVGLYPMPQVGMPIEFWYTDRGPDSLVMISLLTVPDIFWQSLKYRVLFRAFSKDGEQRDPRRARVCDEWYKLNAYMAQKFMKGVEAAMERKGTAVPQPAPQQQEDAA
jgi:hypothetical protein